VPQDAALRCEKSFVRGSSSDVWLFSTVVGVVVKGVVASSLLFSPCRSFTRFPLPTSLIDSVAVFLLVVEVVVLVIEVVVVVVVVVVLVVVVVIVVVVVVVVIVVVGEFLNLIVDNVDLVTVG